MTTALIITHSKPKAKRPGEGAYILSPSSNSSVFHCSWS